MGESMDRYGSYEAEMAARNKAKTNASQEQPPERRSLEGMLAYAREHLPALRRDGTIGDIGPRGRAVVPAYDLVKLLEELKNWRTHGHS